MSLSISKSHNNYQKINWLVYDILDKFLTKNSDKFKGSLYDLGCGDAEYKEFFLKYATSYTGVDWSKSMHEFKGDIKANLNQALPIESECSNTVVSLSVMEHLSEPQIMLNEASRILTKGGFLVLQVPWQWKVHEGPYDFYRYSPFALKKMLTKAGFDQIIIEPTSGFFSMWIVKFNYFTNRMIGGSRFFRGIQKIFFIPIWYLGQKIAPRLDKLDKNWMLETMGYFVTARKC
ncbi:MAG: class I SAM-dependent methyltransferase [Cyclobacteriaceae bacterium]|nr:class I SAM-dependent methyltransferase [Cyclobacteriaceae bacterium]